MAATTLAVVLAVLLPLLTAGETCVGPKVTSQEYSTSNILLATETVFIVEFSLKCENKPQDLNLYAEVNGAVLQVSKGAENKFQVSWSEEHKKASSGVYKINFMDEEGYSAFRKSQRTGGDIDVKSLFTLTLNHKGAGREGLWVQTELIAVISLLLIWWGAYQIKNKVES